MSPQSQNILVAVVALALGAGCLAAAFTRGKLVAWSGMARRIERWGGWPAIVMVYGSLGIFLIGVGISLLTETR